MALGSGLIAGVEDLATTLYYLQRGYRPRRTDQPGASIFGGPGTFYLPGVASQLRLTMQTPQQPGPLTTGPATGSGGGLVGPPTTPPNPPSTSPSVPAPTMPMVVPKTTPSETPTGPSISPSAGASDEPIPGPRNGRGQVPRRRPQDRPIAGGGIVPFARPVVN
jgi:hypothetical protein